MHCTVQQEISLMIMHCLLVRWEGLGAVVRAPRKRTVQRGMHSEL